jgi:cation/acetate symporter
VFGGALGEALSALVAAGAFAAFLSTASGLAVSVAGVLSQDVLRARTGRVRSLLGDGVRRFRIGTVISVVVPFALALVAGRLNLAETVALAFAVSASTFCPLLVLGIWWPRLTRRGAQAGLAAGGALASAAVLVTMVGGTSSAAADALLAQPAAWSVPVAFAVMVGVSLATRHTLPPDVGRVLVRLHAPEGLGLDAGRTR